MGYFGKKKPAKMSKLHFMSKIIGTRGFSRALIMNPLAKIVKTTWRIQYGRHAYKKAGRIRLKLESGGIRGR